MAEAAREASASRSSSRHSQLQDASNSEIDMQYNDEEPEMNPEQIAFLKAMQAADIGDQASMLHDLGMMGIGSAHDSVKSLLKMLAQQDQEHRRPEEHYLTIAQNGKWCIRTQV